MRAWWPSYHCFSWGVRDQCGHHCGPTPATYVLCSVYTLGDASTHQNIPEWHGNLPCIPGATYCMPMVFPIQMSRSLLIFLWILDWRSLHLRDIRTESQLSQLQAIRNLHSHANILISQLWLQIYSYNYQTWNHKIFQKYRCLNGYLLLHTQIKNWLSDWLLSAPTSVLSLKMHHPDWVSVAIGPHFSSQPQDASYWLSLWLPSAPTSVLSLKIHHPDWVSCCHQLPLQFLASRCIILIGSLVVISPHFSSQPQDASSWLSLWLPAAPHFTSQPQIHHPYWVSGCHRPPLQFSAPRCIILAESLFAISPHFSSQPQDASSWLGLWLPSTPTSILSLTMHHPGWIFSCHQPHHIND